MENHNLTNVIFLLIFTTVFMVLCVLFTNNASYLKADAKSGFNRNVIIKQDRHNEDDLNKVVGKWQMCQQDFNCYMVKIEKYKDKFLYSHYLLPSGDEYSGTVYSTIYNNDNALKSTVYYNSIVNDTTVINEHYDIYMLDFSNINNNNILKIDNFNYYRVID